ncbi:hypothetical protein [Haloplasma contractile]|uniref:DUF3397 domain-containing protein n=1 Tax=Haloplasma contractile SSD-17B TaxID=1033810 RepID=F7PU92_9MOLU|nr:hypothetical protein [Haloplasma contractile]ERJ11722.1 hypothetical protein HLPCO_002205 [Haloplasma contractile SSD-17B]
MLFLADMEKALGSLGDGVIVIGFPFMLILYWFAFKYAGYGKVKGMTQLFTIFVVVTFFLQNSLLLLVSFNLVVILYIFYVYLVDLVIRGYGSKRYRRYFLNRIMFLSFLLVALVALRLIILGQ